jgi:Enoyl-(Acyl carrier protein) reductase
VLNISETYVKHNTYLILKKCSPNKSSAPVNPQYCTAKAALVAFTRCVGPVLLNKENITVNAICPAFIATGLAPKAVLEVFPKEHLAPMSTALRAYDTRTFLADDSMTGRRWRSVSTSYIFGSRSSGRMSRKGGWRRRHLRYCGRKRIKRLRHGTMRYSSIVVSHALELR